MGIRANIFKGFQYSPSCDSRRLAVARTRAGALFANGGSPENTDTYTEKDTIIGKKHGINDRFSRSLR